MAGLYRRALQIRRRSRSRTAQAASDETTGGLNEEERLEIEGQIEHLFTDRRLVPAESISKSELKSGALFPVMVNLGVLALLAAGIWFLIIPSWRNETGAVEAGEGFETTEGFIVERVREQAQAELSEREQRIAEIRRQLEQLRDQQGTTPGTREEGGEEAQALQEELEQLLSEMEGLRAEAEQEQAAATSAFEQRLRTLQERQEQEQFILNQLGFSYAAVDRHLSESNSGAAIEELNRADRFLADYSVDDSGAFGNTVNILQQGNAALREALELYQEASEVDPREAEQLRRVAAASALVDEADSLIAAGNEAEAENLYREALTELAATERAFAQVESIEAERLAAERADNREAREQLQAQLEAARDEAASREAELRQELADTRSALATAEAALREARADSGSDDVATVTAREREIATLRSRVTALQSDLERSSARVALLESRIDQRNSSIAALQSEAQEQLSAVRATLATELGERRSPDRQQLEELLETKTLIREVLSSDAVRREHPELYEEMELYLDALGDRRVSEGETQGLYAAVTALQELMEGIGVDPATSVSPVTSREELREALAMELFVLVEGVLQEAR